MGWIHPVLFKQIKNFGMQKKKSAGMLNLKIWTKDNISGQRNDSFN